MISKLDGWYTGDGPDSDIALYSRCDIARNISGFLFPNTISLSDSADIISLVFSFFDSLEDSNYFKKLKLKAIDPLSVKLLEERGVILPDMPEKIEKAVLVHENGSLYVGLNLEDHINISSFTAGMDPKDVYARASSMEIKMRKKILFSADKEAGFLTSDIMGIGTGLKFSVLCSLPGVLYSNSLSTVLESTKENNLNVAGYYSPNSKNSIGALFLISTSVAAGDDEEIQTSNFISGVNNIIEIERNMRKTFFNENPLKVEDMLRRSFAISQSAKLMDFKEAADVVFKIKFGLNLGLVKGITNEECNSMIFKAQMGHLAFLLLNSNMLLADKNLNDLSIEEYRAHIVQELCSKVRIIM
ncbi:MULTISPECIES: ATP--guanido phosphotransferase [unclassified Treponema]|uniref:ATP--guanido phosphotransferase n=1 Tax=unclassified Treponema TaxID=2638727 RepID=UPI0020A4C79A|nr:MULTISPECIES: ATP--guanido phosphotransferase [unclassified Treponema]UTC67737.1 ATP--guanido phosphotransferase [Treponema sp. OMZ 789]UTC70465.1 ATP--guanido phosphotransferase [Treponema sp. OMZ 790]UTC73175.1 ATP--guanido phosphotransferase [Treponema sp. OMZ 791]